MRTIPLLIGVLLLTVSANAQTGKIFNLTKTPDAYNAKCIYRSEVKGLSPGAAFLLQELTTLDRQLTKADTAIINKYCLKQTRDGIFVGAFLMLPEGFDAEELSKFGIIKSFAHGNLASVLIPIDSFVAFCKAQIAEYIDTGDKVKPSMDGARNVTKANQVNQGIELPAGYYGKDVVVGIIDIGFDYTHPNFYDSTQLNYRVKRVWEQTSSAGSAPATFNYGSELTTAASILNKAYSRRNQSHGTHVAGIAAGGGTTTQSCKKYKGIAPESDIVLVDTDMSISGIWDGIRYIVKYAESVGKPCVINMSLSSQMGPHDGTSPFDMACDALTAENPNGLLLVGAAGNEGDSAMHLNYEFSGNNTLAETFIGFDGNQAAGSGMIDIWGSDDFSIQLCVYNANAHSIESSILLSTSDLTIGSSTSSSYILLDNDTPSPDTCTVQVSMSSTQGKRHMRLNIDNTQQGDNHKPLGLGILGNGMVHLWHNDSDNGFYSRGFVNAQVGDDFFTCGEVGGTGNSMITVGAYNSKVSWPAIDGNTYGFQSNNTVGDIAAFSSRGPSVDLRIKPDVSAPGRLIVSSVNSFDAGNYNSNSLYAVERITNSAGNDWFFAGMQGTSMATPVVTGILALWLEAYPELTIAQARQLIKETAVRDNFTGTLDTSVATLQNALWGVGKIDAHEGIKKLLQKIPNKHVFNMGTVRVCGDGQTAISAPEGYRYIWSNGDTARTIQISQSGNYSVQLVSEEGYKSPWSDTITVVLYPYNAPIITGNTEICQGSSTTITVENASSILWSTGQNTNSLTVSPNHSRTYGFTMTDVNGCNYSDSIQITVHQRNQVNLVASICQGSTYAENGFNVGEAGTYTRTLQTVNGCDSVVTLNLTVNPLANTPLTAAICQGSTYAENGFNVGEAGTYTRTLQTVNGCDSVVTLNLTVDPLASTTLTAAICEGSTYAENGFNVGEAGTYTRTLQTVNGCDSIVTLNLSVEEPQQTSLNAAICQGSTYSENGFNVDEAGTYTRTLQTVNGCDSVVTLNLSVEEPQQTNLNAAICQGSTYSENGFNVGEAGTYTRTLQTIDGCDSIVTLTLTVNPAYNITIDASINDGETYEENGFSESQAGTYTHTLQSEFGCDSVITLNLTVNSSLNDVVANAVEIELYPNPANAYTLLKVEGLKEEATVRLFDIQGHKLREYVLKAGQKALKVDLDSLQKGVYFVNIGNTTKKLIIE